jgi:O-antigen ligase
MMMVLLIASFVVTRLKNMIWGGGAYQASNDARENQIAQGIDIVMLHPWGHGIGRAAETLGYTNAAGVTTIDTYYLSIALEAGILGFIAYYGAFIAILVTGIKHVVTAGDQEETSWLLPALLSLGNFIVIKSVLSQQENHPFAFAILGMAVALIHRIKTSVEPARPEFPRDAGLSAK